MDRRVEALKQVNLVEFLSQHYGRRFVRRGAAFACCSPFTAESNPSFFVRLVGGHWLFKDFSSGAGGSILDFVQMKEKLQSFSEALAFLRRLLPAVSLSEQVGERPGRAPANGSGAARPYDVAALYDRFLGEDPEVCRQYLYGRKIAPELVEGLIRDGTVVHNFYEGRSYCAFAVRDEAGRLRCLDNHAVEGKGKFVLGEKGPFSLEWEEVRRAKAVFVTEGIIDYLSVKSLERTPPPGLALLGNQLCFDPSVLDGAEVLLSAMDDDQGGDSAVLDLKERYPDKEVRLYDLEGHKDPNEFLQAVRSGKGRTLSPERKLQLYREFQQSDNKAELARRWGMDRSHLYEIVRESEQMLVEGFSRRKPGRRPKGKPGTLEQALERIEELEAAYERKATEQEEQYCRSEFLAIRLKWAEIEAAELRGEKVDGDKGPKKKPQIKKKKSRRRSKR
jgi:DNA primase